MRYYPCLDIMQRVSDDILLLDMEGSRLSALLGCSRRTLYNYINMTSSIGIIQLKALCELTHKSADYYIYGRS